jgi:very-short-patch-repair endonuclease
MAETKEKRLAPKLAKARQLRKNMTDAEKKLWSGLRRNQLGEYKFRRQFPLGKYIVDFVCLESRLIIEVDGGQHQENRTYDEQRDAWLSSQKFNVLRFWNNEVLENYEGVMEKILSTLKNLTPPSQPSPARGKERSLNEDL